MPIRLTVGDDRTFFKPAGRAESRDDGPAAGVPGAKRKDPEHFCPGLEGVP